MTDEDAPFHAQGLFTGLTREEGEEILAAGSPISFPSEAAIFRSGDHGDAMYVITAGAAKVEVGGRFHILHAGDFFGEMALLAPGPRMATIVGRRRRGNGADPRRGVRALRARAPGRRDGDDEAARDPPPRGRAAHRRLDGLTQPPNGGPRLATIGRWSGAAPNADAPPAGRGVVMRPGSRHRLVAAASIVALVASVAVLSANAGAATSAHPKARAAQPAGSDRPPTVGRSTATATASPTSWRTG